jgi:hypothetical protein
LPIAQGLKAQRKTAAWDTTTISRLFNYKLMTFFWHVISNIPIIQSISENLSGCLCQTWLKKLKNMVIFALKKSSSFFRRKEGMASSL